MRNAKSRAKPLGENVTSSPKRHHGSLVHFATPPSTAEIQSTDSSFSIFYRHYCASHQIAVSFDHCSHFSGLRPISFQFQLESHVCPFMHQTQIRFQGYLKVKRWKKNTSPSTAMTRDLRNIILPRLQPHSSASDSSLETQSDGTLAHTSPPFISHTHESRQRKETDQKDRSRSKKKRQRGSVGGGAISVCR